MKCDYCQRAVKSMHYEATGPRRNVFICDPCWDAIVCSSFDLQDLCRDWAATLAATRPPHKFAY